MLLFLREKSSIGTSAMGLEHFMKPEHFDLIIASVKSLCSFDQSRKTSAVEAGPFLKELCCHIDWKRSQTKGETVLQTNHSLHISHQSPCQCLKAKVEQDRASAFD